MNPLPYSLPHSVFFLIAVFLVTTRIFPIGALAHGEDRPGPHGGFIKMPGAFHTEVQKLNARSVKIYLLDINWKNPTTEKSSVQVKYLKNDTTDDLATADGICENKKSHFICTLPSSVDLEKNGTLLLIAERSGMKGIPVKYTLPLRLDSNKHSTHH